MIITATPLRVSFLGGGTDYPEHFTAHGGATLATSINKYTYITVTRLTEFFDYNIRVSYSRTELCKSVDDIQHPSVRECLKFLKITGGIEISVISDLPARTGLGSSSSFTVGLLHALHAFHGQVASREQLAAEAVHVERNLIQERVGLQDQYACAIGGPLHMEFHEQNRVTLTPVIIPPHRAAALEGRLMMFYTGLQRTAHELLAEQLQRTSAGAITPYLKQLRQLVPQGLDILTGKDDLAELGKLLHQGWSLKRRFSDTVSNTLIDQAYEKAIRAGATGGKLLGAGGGGFLLLYVEPYYQPAVRQALAGMKEVSFSFENQGSRLVYYRPDALDPAEAFRAKFQDVPLYPNASPLPAAKVA
jgi:D-glycero-alpha-D-manno-heptose-7-phosphate kinase